MKKLIAVLFSVFAFSAFACQSPEGDQPEGDRVYEKKDFVRVSPSTFGRYGKDISKFFAFGKKRKPSAGGKGAAQRDAYRMSQIEMENQ